MFIVARTVLFYNNTFPTSIYTPKRDSLSWNIEQHKNLMTPCGTSSPYIVAPFEKKRTLLFVSHFCQSNKFGRAHSNPRLHTVKCQNRSVLIMSKGSSGDKVYFDREQMGGGEKGIGRK